MRPVGPNQPVFIIAEAGVNHNGNVNLALELIRQAADAGADAIKFQTFRASDVVTKEGEMAPYQKKNLQISSSQLQMLQKLELDETSYPVLLKACEQRRILFLSTPHGGFASVDLLESFHVSAYKIASPDLTNLPLLDYIAARRKPMILSTGMATIEEIKMAIKTILQRENNRIILLHCTTSYPCPYDQVHLRAMQYMMKTFPYPIGYSDHTEGIDVSIWATLLGATLIEKHFTIDRRLPGPDQKNSLTPQELKKMIQGIRAVQNLPKEKYIESIHRIPENVLGHSQKIPSQNEQTIARHIRKSLVWAHSLKKDHIVSTTNDIEIKRPGNGIPPKAYWSLEGKRLRRNVIKDTLIRPGDFA